MIFLRIKLKVNRVYRIPNTSNLLPMNKCVIATFNIHYLLESFKKMVSLLYTNLDGLIICQLSLTHLCRVVISSPRCPGYDIKVNLMVRIQFWGVWSISSLSSLLGPILSRVVLLSSTIPFLNLFKNYLYLLGTHNAI